MNALRLAAGVILPAWLFAAPTAENAPVFEKDVLPILSTYCFTCHGKSSPELGVDLRTATSVLRGGFNGPVVEKGAPDKSRLYLKVSGHEMPPPAFNSVVPDADIAVIRRWIETGAQSNAESEIPESARRQIDRFEHDVLPILEARCVACHGETPQSGLDLRSLAALLRGGKQGPVLEEGFSEKSILVRQIESGAMPPKGAGEALTRAEIARIRGWIDEGGFADYVDKGNPLDRAFTEAEAPEITAEDRKAWAFQKPVAHDPPRVKSQDRVRSPIDAFVLAKLEDKGLTLSAEASKRTLLRRAYFDLWGLPPTPEETAAFLGDSRPDAYERLLDRLLASPKYGQRWGRFWLDAAGYVDTTGKDFQANNVSVAPGMWRYRDYVIEAFNEDKPWDRFLTEQLAGDELYDFRNAREYTPEMLKALIATGYLRTQLDATDEDISDRPADRYDAMFAMLDKVSASALGLTLTCARCHTHKFDPIPQRDYYRFLALFSSAYNPSAWIQPKKRLMYTVADSERKEIEEHNKSIDAETKKLEDQIAEILDPYRKKLRAEKLKEAPEEIRSDLAEALDVEAKERSEVQKYLIAKFGKLAKLSEEELDEALSKDHTAEVAKLRKDLETWNGYRRELHPIRALWDGKDHSPTMRLLQRGSVEAPGPRVSPGFLSILCSPGDDCTAEPSSHRAGDTSGLRLALAEWLTSPDHPLTARVIVNRLWQHHFGTGIVATVDNFGEMGSGASHPELLDWLAVDFMEHGWKAKRLHKQIMLSSAYRQSSKRSDNPSADRAESEDSENRLLWRMPLRRLEAEALRDSILAVAGRLDDSLDGPPVELTARPDGLQFAEDDGPKARRSVYLLARRTWPSTFLAVFDFPIIDTTCTRRTPSATPLQSLTLMNSEFVLHNARVAAERLGGGEAAPADFVDKAYDLLFARPAGDAERALAVAHLKEQQALYGKSNASEQESAARAAESLIHMLLSSNEFLYVD
ncbi:MAG: DUF1553 domain-containing protein [Bryobacterales bacterium]